jgi:hypothetical protein
MSQFIHGLILMAQVSFGQSKKQAARLRLHLFYCYVASLLVLLYRRADR